MSHKDNMDLRNTGDGGWFYAEHELFSVFAPLIGADGVVVYMAMCRLIPLAAVDQDRQVTIRAIEEASTVSRAQAQRKKNEIVALGMVEEKPGAGRRPSTYKLVSLRQLSLVGIGELKRRISVPPWDTKMKPAQRPAVLKRIAAGSDIPAERQHSPTSQAARVEPPSKAPRASGKTGVSRWDTKAGLRKKPGLSPFVSQKQGFVSQEKLVVSQKRGFVSQGEALYLKKKKKEEEENTPLPPSQAKGVLFPDLPDDSLPSPGTSNRKIPPARGRVPEPAYDPAVSLAVAKVMRECNLSEPRLGPVIERAMRSEAAKTDERPNWNDIAERISKAQRWYVHLGRAGVLRVTVRVRRFLAEGLWRDDGLWNIDQARLDRLNQATLGTYQGGTG